MDNYKEIEILIAGHLNFNGNSCKGNSIIRNGFVEYDVYSYSTLILRATKNNIYFDNTFYSTTTSRIQNIILNNLWVENYGSKKLLDVLNAQGRIERKEYNYKQ